MFPHCGFVVLFKFAKQRQYIFKEFKANWVAAKGDIPVKKATLDTSEKYKKRTETKIRRKINPPSKIRKYRPKYIQGLIV